MFSFSFILFLLVYKLCPKQFPGELTHCFDIAWSWLNRADNPDHLVNYQTVTNKRVVKRIESFNIKTRRSEAVNFGQVGIRYLKFFKL